MHKQSLGTAARAYGGIIQHWSQRPRPPAPGPRACESMLLDLQQLGACAQTESVRSCN